MTSIAEFRRALAEVPAVLLSADDQRVLVDARVMLDVLEGIDVVPKSIVFVGASGSGKSSIVNATMGSDIAEVGVRRPTTDLVSMYGSSGPLSLAARSEYVHVPAVRAGLVLIDTPPWEHGREDVRSAMAVADLGVVVVTPSRYADASVAELVADLPAGRPAAVVLNRITSVDDERATLTASVAERFGSDVVEVEEHGDLRAAAERLLDTLEVDSVGYERAAIVRSAAAASGRHLAGAATAAAPDVAALRQAIDLVDIEGVVPGIHTVLEEWPATRSEIVRQVTGAMRAVDDRISISSGVELTDRVRAELPGWEPGLMAADLDDWRQRTVERFTAEARIRWRRAAAQSMLDRYAWRVAINRSVEVPSRMRRMLGPRLDVARDETSGDLATLVEGVVQARVEAWSTHADRLGAFTPGVLSTAADGFAVGST